MKLAMAMRSGRTGGGAVGGTQLVPSGRPQRLVHRTRRWGGKGMAEAGPLLFGRRTYEDFFAVWPGRKDNPFTAVLDNSQKYVASRTLREPLPWQNSTLLAGDAAETVARLKAQPGKDIAVLGSGDMMQTLMRHGLVDEYVLLIHPLVLGRGRRLFNDDARHSAFRLVHSVPTTTGVM